MHKKYRKYLTVLVLILIFLFYKRSIVKERFIGFMKLIKYGLKIRKVIKRANKINRAVKAMDRLVNDTPKKNE